LKFFCYKRLKLLYALAFTRFINIELVYQLQDYKPAPSAWIVLNNT